MSQANFICGGIAEVPFGGGQLGVTGYACTARVNDYSADRFPLRSSAYFCRVSRLSPDAAALKIIAGQ